MTTKQKEKPRGIRNNNPLNIRIGNVWLGEVKENTDGEFEQFISLKYGLRAAFVLLRRYICHYRLNSIAQIVSRWAPSSENNTRKYIKFVSERVGIADYSVVDYYDKVTICKLVEAMAYYECGTSIPFDTIEKAYDLC